MSVKRALIGLLMAAAAALSGCGASDPASPPLSQWCTDPPRDASGNTVLTLVKRPDASLPNKLSMQFNDQPEVIFVDDGTGLDAKAGDGVYTHSAKVPTTPTEHTCNPVLTSSSPALTSSSADSLIQAVGLSGSCTVRTCNTCAAAAFGLPCVCVSCSVTITF